MSPGEPARAASLAEHTTPAAEERAEILRGLKRGHRKQLSPKYFYDAEGSRLFEEICTLPEYYLTRTEVAIMQAQREAICAAVGPDASLIEFGSGSSVKTRLLLEWLPRLAAYVPVDISREPLLAAARTLARDFPQVEILPVCADFTRPFDLPQPKRMPRRNIVYFPGSTIGNFETEAAVSLLSVMRHEARDDGALLIGVDLQKDPAIIEAAYNDSRGVTARFNLNALRHLNREFGADFDLDAFRHRAVYDAQAGRMELQLVSLRAQRVRIAGEVLDFRAGEAVTTEYSHKYSVEGFAQLARRAGFRVEQVWTDPERLFSLQFLAADGTG